MSLLARLIEAGTPAELVAEVAEELARAKVAQEAIENSRKKARERQARKRERDAQESDVTSCHVTERDRRDTPLPLPPNENNSNPPTPAPVNNTTRARRGHRLPDDWEPKPLSAEVAALVAAWPAGSIERELAKFRDWAASATGSNSRKSDWDAAWRNWLRRRDEEQPRNLANGRQQTSNSNTARLALEKLGMAGGGT